MSHLSENETHTSLPTASRCCSLPRLVTPTLVLVSVVSICAAAYFAGRSSVTINTNQLGGQLPLVNATAALTSEKYSLATGMVSDECEALFVLDHNSGLLQCNAIYPRMGGNQIMASFKSNVADALGTGGKGGSYMMITGHADFRSQSNAPAATTVLYVMDTATGNYACYGVPFDRVAQNARRPQQGAMVLLLTGSANPIVDRDTLR